MLRRFQLLKRMLADLGIEEQRLRLEWISAAEGEKVQRVVNEMSQQLKALGPLGMPGKFDAWDREVEHLACEIAAKESASGAGGAQAAPAPAPTAKPELAHV
jgi:F420-non-reducing hydrogenase iron-sulfur subunit